MKNIIFWALALILVSCGQDEKLSKTLMSEHDTQFASDACAQVSVKNDVITKNNFHQTLTCLNLANKLDIFDFIKSLNDEDFQKLILKINDVEESGKLSELADIFLYDVDEKSIREINTVLKNTERILVKSSLLRNLNKEEHIKNNYVPPSLSNDLITIIKKTSLKFDLASLREFLKIKENSHFIDLIAMNFSEKKFTLKTFEFLKNINPKYAKAQSFSDIVTFFKDNTPKIKILKSILDKLSIGGLRCENAENISLDFKFELNRFFEKLREKDRNSFEDYFLDLLTNFSLYQKICAKNQDTLNFNELLNLVADLLLKEQGFDILYSVGVIAQFNLNHFQDLIKSELMSEFTMFLNQADQKSLNNLTNILIDITRLSLWNDENEEGRAFKHILLSTNLIEDLNSIYILLGDTTEQRIDSLLLLLGIGYSDQTISIVKKIIKVHPQIIESIFDLLKGDTLEHISLRERMNSFLLRPNLKGSYFEVNPVGDFIAFLRSVIKKREFKKDQESVDVIETPSPLGNEISHKCFQEFTSLFSKTSNFETMVNSLSKDCVEHRISSVPSLMLGWNQFSAKMFNEMFPGKSFLRDDGLLGDKMMKFYQSLLVKISISVRNETNFFFKSLWEFIDNDNFFQGIEKDISLVLSNSRVVKAGEVILESLMEINSFKFKNLFENLVNKQAPFTSDFETSENINESQMNTGSDLSLFKDWTQDILNGNDVDKLINSLLYLMADDEEIRIGSGRKYRKYKTSLENVVKFLFYVTDPEFKKEIQFFRNGISQKEKVLLSERLEILIREISFSGNYYGSYFMNTIAQSDDYVKTIKKLKKFVKLLDSNDGFFQKLGYLPKDADDRFKNINETYDSLLEISEKKFGNNESLDGFIHALLYQVVSSSPESAQKFSPFKKPNGKKVKYHNGKLITLLAKKSLITKMGQVLRESCKTITNCLGDEPLISLKKTIRNLRSINMGGHIKEISKNIKDSGIVVKAYDEIALAKLNEKSLLKNIAFLFDFEPTLGYLENTFLSFIEVTLNKERVKNLGSLLSFKKTNVILRAFNDFYKSLAGSEKEIMHRYLKKNENYFYDIISIQNIEMLLEIRENHQRSTLDDKTRLSIESFMKTNSFSYEYIHIALSGIFEKDQSLNYLTNILSFAIDTNETEQSNLTKARRALLNNKETIESFLLDHFNMFSPIKN